MYSSVPETWFEYGSIWEILIKVQLESFEFPDPAGPYVIRKLATIGS